MCWSGLLASTQVPGTEEPSPPPTSDRTPPLLVPELLPSASPSSPCARSAVPLPPRNLAAPAARAPLPEAPHTARGPAGARGAAWPLRRAADTSPRARPETHPPLGEARRRARRRLARAFPGAGFGVLVPECLCPHPGKASGEPLLAARPQSPRFLEQNCIRCQIPLPTLKLKLSMNFFFFFSSFSRRRDTG